jgi:hypothetical protein
MPQGEFTMSEAFPGMFADLLSRSLLVGQTNTGPNVFQSIFSRPDICVLVCSAAVAITGIIVWGIVAARSSTLEANLKQMMIERGLPAEEIERILYASSENPPKNPPRSTASKAPIPAKGLN